MKSSGKRVGVVLENGWVWFWNIGGWGSEYIDIATMVTWARYVYIVPTD